MQELDAGLLLDGQHALLAGTGVDQQAQGQRLVGIGGEILDGLGLAVFDYVEVALVRPGISRPCLSFTLKKILTTLTCALKVVGSVFVLRLLRLLVLGLRSHR